MRNVLSIGLLVAVVAARQCSNPWGLDAPDDTADWYIRHGEPLPEPAPEITTLKTNKSYVVKLGCMGCPFRVHDRTGHDYWQEPPPDNSLLLNFTVDDATPGLLLNSMRIAPLGPMPVAISAFQKPMNLSKDAMNALTCNSQLDGYWVIGPEYELQYEHTLVGTRASSRNWVQFDITAIHLRWIYEQTGVRLDNKAQKMVQVLLWEPVGRAELYIEDIQVVERKDRVKPYRMNCGKMAMIKSEFNPLEWDAYGKLGTWSRSWRKTVLATEHFWANNGIAFVFWAVMATAAILLRPYFKRVQERIARAKEEAVATSLLSAGSDGHLASPDDPVINQKEEECWIARR